MSRWNHSIHYYPRLLEAVPAECSRALDVGCGDGSFTRELGTIAERVIGIDRDPLSIELARAQGGEQIEYILGDLLDYPFEPASFDLVASVATLHHMDAEAGLARMAALVRPGGVLVVLGLARSRGVWDLGCDLAGFATSHLSRRLLRKQYWEHASPTVWPPPHSYAELRRIAARVLPGVQYRRHLLWRCSLVWTRPALSANSFGRSDDRYDS